MNPGELQFFKFASERGGTQKKKRGGGWGGWGSNPGGNYVTRPE